MTNTIITIEDRSFRLLKDAYPTNALFGVIYEAPRISTTHAADEDGYVPHYLLQWTVTNPDAETAEDTCDWDHPSEVIESGEYNLKTHSYWL